jgi:hypothetical protein
VADLWGTLGYDRTAAKIAHSLRESRDILMIEGPPGVGKSWLAQGIGVLWQEGGGSAVLAEGDSLRSASPFHPFGFAMKPMTGGWKSLGPALANVTKAGERLLVGSGGIITSTVELLAKSRRAAGIHRALYLGETEQRVLAELSDLSGKRPLLLIADNLHWWDEQSLAFLGRLRDPRMWDAFPFLEELRVLATQTLERYQSVAHPVAHRILLAPTTTRTFRLDLIGRDGFERVLALLGADPEPSVEVTDLVHHLTCGHLALAASIAPRLTTADVDSLLAAADTEEFVHRLLTARMQSLGPMGEQAVALLQVAAVLGLSFRRHEVMCAAGKDEAETARLLRYCRRENVLELSDGVGRFVHDVFRRHFSDVVDEDKVDIHERLADCLRQLRSAEYDLRCLNAVEAERPREAAALAVQSALQREREGQSWHDLPQPLLVAIHDGGLMPVVEQLVAAHRHLRQYQFRDCFHALDSVPRGLPKGLAAEADYLRASCLMSTRSGDDRAEGVAILQGWAGYEAEEPELGIRLMHQLLYGLSLAIDKGPGRELEGRIKQVLLDRVSFDLSAEDAFYTMGRSAGSLYQPEIAVVRNREAVRHFGPAPGQALVRRPVEYYRCLVNLGANLISNACYEEARAVYQDVERLVGEYADGVFPRLDYGRMNSLQAEYRLGAVGAAQAVERQRDIVASAGVAGDPFYPGNALGVYLALAGELGEALEVLEGLIEQLSRRSVPETSMAYTIRANLAAVRFVRGDRAAALAEWTELGDVVGRIPYAITPFLVRRHELLAAVIRDGPVPSPASFDDCLVADAPIEFGPFWRQLGRGFRMPEVEWWS